MNIETILYESLFLTLHIDIFCLRPGPVQSLLVHFGGSRSREGGEAEAVFASRTRRQRAQVDVNYGEKRIISKIFNDYLKRRFIV